MSHTDPDDPLTWSVSTTPNSPEPPAGEPSPPREPVRDELPGEYLPLPPEPTYDPSEPVEEIEIAEVVRTICWWCGDPAILNIDSLCPSCELRKRERDRREEAERRRRRERDRAGYDFDYDEPDEEDEEEYEVEWYSRQRTARARRAQAEELNWHGPLQGVMILYVILMLVSIVWGASLLSRRGEMTQDDLLHGMAVVEIIDTIIVLLSLALVTRAPLPEIRPGVMPVAWGVGIPVLVLLIGLNLLYTALLRQALNAGEVEGHIPLTLLTVLLICVQPAVIEELFFRYIAFGGMYRAAGLHATVWITGMMFAVMHIYNPLGVPYLLLAGVVFGYARVWGGLGLPIVMHFIHNLVIVAIESGR